MRQHAATDLAVPVVDTDGRQLRLSTSPGTHLAVASLSIPVGDSMAHLEVLAASHRVRLVGPCGTTVTETVACDGTDASSVQLPSDSQWVVGERSMSFSSQIRFGGNAVDSAAAVIGALDPACSIVVRFPGNELALTAIELFAASGDQVISWRTWHLYPGAEAHVVTTSTTAFTDTVASTTASAPSSLELQGAS